MLEGEDLQMWVKVKGRQSAGVRPGHLQAAESSGEVVVSLGKHAPVW